jgi:hypothetical protein
MFIKYTTSETKIRFNLMIPHNIKYRIGDLYQEKASATFSPQCKQQEINAITRIAQNNC